MLRTNSRKAKNNLHNYILDNFTPEDYTDNPPEEFAEVAAFIYEVFKNAQYNTLQDFQYYKRNECAAFANWAAGLPGVLDTCYFYSRSAVDDLAEILEETEAERKKYTETQAENLLTYLIYREIKGALK